jgi:hypothetical protein
MSWIRHHLAALLSIGWILAVGLGLNLVFGYPFPRNMASATFVRYAPRVFGVLLLVLMFATPIAAALHLLRSWKQPVLTRSARFVLVFESAAFCAGMIAFWIFCR